MKKNIATFIFAIILTSTAGAETNEFSEVSFETEDKEAIVIASLDMKELRGNLQKARHQAKLLSVKTAIKLAND